MSEEDVFEGQDQEGSAAGGQDPDKETVPVSVVQAIREELKDLKGQNAQLQQQVNLYQASLYSQSQGRDNQPKEEVFFEGLEDDEPVTAGEIRKVLKQFEGKSQVAVSQAQFIARAPDFEKIIRTHLPKLIEQDPDLALMIRQSGNPVMAAYKIAKLAAKAEEAQVKKNSDGEKETERILDNLKKPGSPAQAGGGGRAGAQPGTKYDRMSDSDLEKKIAELSSRG